MFGQLWLFFFLFRSLSYITVCFSWILHCTSNRLYLHLCSCLWNQRRVQFLLCKTQGKYCHSEISENSLLIQEAQALLLTQVCLSGNSVVLPGDRVGRVTKHCLWQGCMPDLAPVPPEQTLEIWCPLCSMNHLLPELWMSHSELSSLWHIPTYTHSQEYMLLVCGQIKALVGNL